MEGLGNLQKSTSSGTRTGDLPACSIVPQLTTLPRAPSCPQCLINYSPRHEDVWGCWDIALPSWNSALDGVEWSASQPCRFTPCVKATGTHWIGGWVGLRAGVDAVEKRKSLCPCRKSNTDLPNHSPSLYPLRYPGSWRSICTNCVY
jgi:hypothetical protein